MSLIEQAILKMRKAATVPAVGVIARKPTVQVDGLAPATTSSRHIVVDRSALRAAGYLPEADADRRFADFYRQIKRPLIAKVQDEALNGEGKARLIVMTSALPGDGKTFTSINLALSMARERDVSVVLVDADVSKRHISGIFGVGAEPGLLDALIDASVDIESLVLETDVPGLSILPAGKPHEGAAELLASERMAQIVARLNTRDQRRITLFDSPPLLVSSESRALSAVAGQLLLVVRADKTPRQAVLDAVAMTGAGAPLSLILNQSDVKLTDGYSAIGYQYGYGTSIT
jgi:exopolysaccharide/PEP-CTERM locus tyrosine autokinase